MTQFSEILRRAGIDQDWLEWTAKANCIGHAAMFDKELPSDDEETSTVDAARYLCNGCQVRRECLDFALRIEEGEGFRDQILGGLTGSEREQIADEPDPVQAGLDLFATKRIIERLDHIEGGHETWEKSQQSWLGPWTQKDGSSKSQVSK